MKEEEEKKNIVLEVQNGFIDVRLIFGNRPSTEVIKNKEVKEDGKVSS